MAAPQPARLGAVRVENARFGVKVFFLSHAAIFIDLRTKYTANFLALWSTGGSRACRLKPLFDSRVGLHYARRVLTDPSSSFWQV